MFLKLSYKGHVNLTFYHQQVIFIKKRKYYHSYKVCFHSSRSSLQYLSCLFHLQALNISVFLFQMFFFFLIGVKPLYTVVLVSALQQSESTICCVLCLVAQPCLPLCAPMDCSLPGSSAHGILQARILEWVAMPSSRGSSQPRDQTQVSHMAGRFFTS